MEGKQSGINTMMGGDFNARTGERGAGIELDKSGREEEEKEKRKRRSKDKKVNRKGRMLVDFLEKRGWGILNGSVIGDEQGEYTFTGEYRTGNTVIDYDGSDETVMGDEMREKIGGMRMEDKMDSDHQPVVVWIKGEEQRRRRGRGNREKIKRGYGMRKKGRRSEEGWTG